MNIVVGRRVKRFEIVFTMSKLLDDADKPKSGTQPLTSLAKGLKLLVSLRDSSRPLSLSELSRELGLHKASTLRILLTLEQHRFIAKNNDKKYQIGSNAFYVGSGFIVGGKRNKLLQVMGKLVHELKHTITLGVLDGASVLFIERVDGVERVKVTVDIGSRVPAHSSAAGKTLLAGLSDAEVMRRLRSVRGDSFNNPVSVKKVLAVLSKVRQNGFAVNNEESTKGLIAVAVPIVGAVGSHLAALGAAFPAGTLRNAAEEKAVAIQLARGAEEIGSLGIQNIREITNMAG
jgi:DNA-binding IclR family transcriptional regulator